MLKKTIIGLVYGHKKTMTVLGGLIFGLVVFSIYFISYRQTSMISPVTYKLQQSVNFPIYFPVQQQLPTGYTLNTSSFHLIQPGVIEYTVNNFRLGIKVVITEEAQASKSIMNQFNQSYLPLHVVNQTRLGQVYIGVSKASGQLRTIASLAINNGPWVILTAPSNISQSAVKQLFQALAS